MTLAVGVDIIDVSRVQAILDRHQARFLTRVYTPQEVADCQGQAPSLAARWAAKEAVSKALGCGWDGIQWTEIEIVRTPHGQPLVSLHGAARTLAEQMGLRQWAISLSHTATYAVAFVVAQCVFGENA